MAKNKMVLVFILLAVLLTSGCAQFKTDTIVQNGIEVIYTPKDKSIAPTADQLKQIEKIIEDRLDAKKVFRNVKIDEKNGAIIVQFKLAETTVPENAVKELGATARLRLVDPDGNIVIEGKHIAKATPEYSQQDGSVYVRLTMNDEGARLFEAATAALVGKVIAIKMDDTVISSPQVVEKISGGEARINGNLTAQEAQDLADKITKGELPFDLVSEWHYIGKTK